MNKFQRTLYYASIILASMAVYNVARTATPVYTIGSQLPVTQPIKQPVPIAPTTTTPVATWTIPNVYPLQPTHNPQL